LSLNKAAGQFGKTSAPNDFAHGVATLDSQDYFAATAAVGMAQDDASYLYETGDNRGKN